MIKAFKVAEHVFCLSLPDDCSLWNNLGQYDPFIVPDTTDSLFDLELVPSVEDAPREVVYDVPTEDGETVVKLYRQGENWLFEMSPDHNVPICARMLAEPGFRKARIEICSRSASKALFSINNGLMLMYAFSTAGLGTLEMHASVIRNEGMSYLFLGKSGTGKSTHSRLWLENIEGSELMNDDNPIVRVWPDGRVIAYGSPWSGKTPCYRNEQAPIGAFVRIRQCPENKIEAMRIVEAYATIYSSCSGFKADRQMADGLHATIEQIVLNVPCYLLDCRPDREAAELCASTVIPR